MRFRFLAFVSLALPQIVLAQPMTTTVDGGMSNGKHLECKAYLSAPTKNHQSVPTLLFMEPGTGVYTTYFNHETGHDYYYLSIDKPGVSPDLKNPGKPIVDRTAFDYYTIKNLVTCAQNALDWAQDYLKNADAKIILQGHSEGTEVMINVVNNIFSNKDKEQLQKNIKAVFLSGVVIQHMSDVIAFQFKGEELRKLMKAYKKHDSDFIYNNYQVGWYWFDDIFRNHESGMVEIRDLAKLPNARNLPIEIFQGLLDEYVPTPPVEKFETQNLSNPKDKQLKVNARYYLSPHHMNETTIFDEKELMKYYFNN